MVVAGNLTLLRPVDAGDIMSIQRWDNDPDIIKLVGKKFLTPGHSLRWFSSIRKSKVRLALAITDSNTGRLIGDVELENISWRSRSGELRVCIGERDYWGKGFGTDAIRSFTDFVFGTMNLDYIYLRVYRSNARAIKCYKKCGFQVEGVLKAGTRAYNGHEDLLLMSRKRRPAAPPSA